MSCLAFFHAERLLTQMTLLKQDCSEQINQALKKQYARHKSKLIVCLFL